jgi:hypothetical protein
MLELKSSLSEEQNVKRKCFKCEYSEERKDYLLKPCKEFDKGIYEKHV